MAETQHTLQETIDLAVKLAVQKAKLDMHPIGKTWLTFGDENPADIVGGGWEKVKSYCLQCSDDTHAAGTVIEAGLPNIEGDIYIELPGGGSPISRAGSGALYNNYSAKSISGYAIDGSYVTRSTDNSIRFNASRSNPIYGRSDTVQPNTIIINVWKRVK